MQHDHITPSAGVPVRNGIVTLSGYGIKVAVDRRRLIVSDGFGRQRRLGRFAKAPSRIRRLVVLGHTGFVSLEALRWLADCGAAFVQIDADGKVLATTAPSKLDDARLRRSQAMALVSGVGLSIARELLATKIRGQAEVLRAFGLGTDRTQRFMTSYVDATAHERLFKSLMQIESAAAAMYFGEWRDVCVPFARADQVPEHWRRFGGRKSLLSGTPHRATNPANAILNYLYALLESETRIALLTAGLDPGMGFGHRDVVARDSLALDVMEAVRPEVDAFALNIMSSGTFRPRDFAETRTGVCRLSANVCHRLSESIPRWSAALAPVVEGIAKTLFATAAENARIAGVTHNSQRATLPTILTKSNRKARFSGVSPDFRPAKSRRRSLEVSAANKVQEQNVDSAGSDKRRASMVAHQTANRAWNRSTHKNIDPKEFSKRILPLIDALPLKDLAKATGLSIRYCSMIRRGMIVPHPRHWEAFRTAVTRNTTRRRP